MTTSTSWQHERAHELFQHLFPKLMFPLHLSNSPIDLWINSAIPFRGCAWVHAQECPPCSLRWASASSRMWAYLSAPSACCCLGVSSCVSFTLQSINHFVACFLEVSCAAQSHSVNNFEGTVFAEHSFFPMVWKAFGATMLLKDCFCFRVVPIHSGPLHPVLATVATHGLIDLCSFACF